jgi:RimJ/RimL family protein N-acetyltransferase
MKKYETERLILRELQDQDLEYLIKIHQDPKVMEFFPKISTSTETKDFIEKNKKHFINYGYGFYACELKTTGALIGWRLDHEYWGQGLAFEAAKRCLDIGFNEFDLHEIVAFTALPNIKSQQLMRRLGMLQQQNFLHPKLPESHWLCEHTFYKLDKTGFIN